MQQFSTPCWLAIQGLPMLHVTAAFEKWKAVRNFPLHTQYTTIMDPKEVN